MRVNWCEARQIGTLARSLVTYRGGAKGRLRDALVGPDLTAEGRRTMPNPMHYPAEHFSDEERALLTPHFTNLDRPVFALVNLPETVKGALFARYSRYSGSVRRLS